MAARLLEWWHAFVAMLGPLVGRTALVALGFVLMVIGLALGVTMVMLPVGLLVGIAGLLMFLLGLFGQLEPVSSN